MENMENLTHDAYFAALRTEREAFLVEFNQFKADVSTVLFQITERLTALEANDTKAKEWAVEVNKTFATIQKTINDVYTYVNGEDAEEHAETNPEDYHNDERDE